MSSLHCLRSVVQAETFPPSPCTQPATYLNGIFTRILQIFLKVHLPTCLNNVLSAQNLFLYLLWISQVLRFITPREDSQDHRGVRCELEPVRPRLHVGLRQRAAQGDAHVSQS